MEGQKTKDDFQDFGISVNHLGVIHSNGWECHDCGWKLERYRFNEWKQFIVGFSKEAPKNPDRPETPEELKTPDNEYIGGIVIECPQCSEKFWFHVTLLAMCLIYQ